MPRMHFKTLAAFLALAAITGTIVPAATNARHAVPPLGNPALLQAMSPAQQAALRQNGFVVASPDRTRHVLGNQPLENLAEWQNSPNAQHAVYWQFSDLYDENYHTGIPTFITTDAALHTFHIIYDNTLQALERTVFIDRLQRLSKGLMDVATYQYGATTNPNVQQAARLNLGYMAVAERLLDPAAGTPAVVAPAVNQELALIAAHKGFATSPLFGIPVDYSQFVPRGHYATSPELGRYFQAMIWYGRLTFGLNGPDAALRTRQALLFVRGLTQIPDLNTLWAAVFDPITTWVGPSDDLTVRDYAAVMAKVYPANAPVSVLSDTALLARFISLADVLPGPRINGGLAGSSKEIAQQKGFRLFGQRFVPDASIMQELIYDKVGTKQQPRVWPLSLDVAAGLGSSRATTLLTSSPMNQQQFAHYTQQLTSIQHSYSTLPASSWQQNLYWGWLDSLRAEWGSIPPAAPAFMKTTAWADKSLAAGLGSWAELRHDTILYVKQPAGLGAGGPPPPLPDAYVEPQPLVFTRLLALTQALKATLAKAGELDSLPLPIEHFSAQEVSYLQPPPPQNERGYRAALDGYVGLLTLLEHDAERELLGETIVPTDEQALRQIGTYFGVLDTFFQDNGLGKVQIPFDRQVAIVADVFTEPGSSQVLEEGVGDVLPIFVEVTVNGHRWLARGGVFSYYEFHQPLSDRLTDTAWRKITTRPPLPAWMGSYMAY